MEANKILAVMSDVELKEDTPDHAKNTFSGLGEHSLVADYRGTFRENGVVIRKFNEEEDLKVLERKMGEHFNPYEFSMERLKQFLDAEGNPYSDAFDGIGDLREQDEYRKFLSLLFSMYKDSRKSSMSDYDLYVLADGIYKGEGCSSLFLLRKKGTAYPDPFDSQGGFCYHFVGRGFMDFGSIARLHKEGGTGITMSIPILITEPHDLEKSHMDYVVRHAYIGHNIGELGDHYDGRGCIMTPMRTSKELYKTLEKGDFSFCEECMEKTPHIQNL